MTQKIFVSSILLAVVFILTGCESVENKNIVVNTPSANSSSNKNNTPTESSEVKNTNTNESDSVSVNQTPPTQASADFGDCQAAFEFGEQSWWTKALAAIEKEGGYVSSKEIGCYASDAQLFVMLNPGDYCKFGKIYRYDIKTDAAQIATINDKGRGCLSAPQDFGPQKEEIFLFQGSSGDAGCSSLMEYEYNFMSNVVELKKETSTCEGDPSSTVKEY